MKPAGVKRLILGVLLALGVAGGALTAMPADHAAAEVQVCGSFPGGSPTRCPLK